MTSAGGLLPVADAAELPAALLLSGPAGGVRAAAAVAVANGFPDAITFDMGGTSTDVCLVLGRRAGAGGRAIGRRLPVRFPALDIHTIGAGGGSIAQLDPGGALVVGPQSAGADPGPGLLRPGWRRAHGHRRRPRRRPDPAGCRVRGLRARPRRRRAGAGRGRRDRRRGDPRWSTPRWSGRCGACRSSGGRPAVAGPGRVRRRRAAARLRAGRRARHGRGDRPGPGRGAVGRRAARRAAPARPRALVAHPLDHTALADARRRAGRRGREAGRPRRRRPRRPSTAATPARATSSRSRRSPPSTRPTGGATASSGPTRRSRSWRCARRRRSRAASSSTDLPAPTRAASGPAAIAESDCTIWMPDGWTAEPGAAGALVLRRTS